MPTFEDITSAWESVAKTNEAQLAIHPSAQSGEDSYDTSGQFQADYIEGLIDQWCSTSRPTIVDFGCGDGRVTKFLADRYEEVYGVDASPTMLERFSKRVPKGYALQSNGIDGNLDDMDADFIFSFAVFIHHSVADGARLLGALSRALGEEGILAVQIPVYERQRERASWVDVTVWTPEVLDAAANAAGLEVVQMFTNSGEFSYTNIGPNHLNLQILAKPPLQKW